MARITWKNVAAPNTGDVVRQQAIASRMINSGAQGIGSSLQALDTNQEGKLSAGAMQQLGQIQDIGKFDELMKNGGLSELGISADRASPELTKMLQGYRDTLAGNRQDDFNFTQGKVEAGRDSTRFNNAQLLFDQGQTDRTETRAEEAETKVEQERLNALDTQATEMVFNELDTGITSQASLDRLRDATADNDELRALVEEKFAAASEGRYSGDPDIEFSSTDEMPIRQTLAATDRDLENEEARLESEAASSPSLRYLSDLPEISGDPLNSMVERRVNQLQKEGLDEEAALYSENASSFREAYRGLRENYNVDPRIIVAVMENSLKGDRTWYGALKEGQEIDLTAAEKELDKLDTPEERAAVRNSGNKITTARERIQAKRKKRDRLEQELRTALTKGRDDAVERLRGEILAMGRGMIPEPEENDPPDSINSAFDQAVGLAGPGSQVPFGASDITRNASAPREDIFNPNAYDEDQAQREQQAQQQAAAGQVGARPNAAPLVPQDPSTPAVNPAAGVVTQTPDPGTRPNSGEAASNPGDVENTVLREAVNDPITTLESIMADSDVPAAVAQEVEQSMAVLQSGREIPDQMRQQVQGRLKEILARIAGERGNNPQDPIAQLLAQPEKWLPF